MTHPRQTQAGGMSPNLRIAVRFLTAKRRSMLMSLAGIVFGVGFFVVTQAQTRGFQQFFIRTILGTDGAIRIEDQIQDTIRSMQAGGQQSASEFELSFREQVKYVEGISDPSRLLEAVRQFENVSGVSQVLRGNVVVSSASRTQSAQVFGISLDEHLSVSDLERQVVQGSLEEFRLSASGLLMGSTMAQRLAVDVGDPVIVESSGYSQRHRVVAIYETGVSDIDKSRLYVHLGQARSLLRKPFGATFLQVNVFDRDRAPADAARMEAALEHSARSWQEREKTWLGVFRALSISSLITVCAIILIAGLGMFNTLAMIVMEKTREIAILRSMGYFRSDILKIFLWQGVLVLVAGTALGWGVGAGITWLVSTIPLQITGIFKTDTFIVAWSWWHYLGAALIAAVVVLTASLIPARRAARLEPGEVIRGAGQ